jgi:uncharacterized protein YlbG (UPF0298 family)
MERIVRSQHHYLFKACGAIAKRNVRLLKSTQYGSVAYNKRRADFKRVFCQVKSIEHVAEVLHKAEMANLANEKVHFQKQIAALPPLTG